MIYIDTSSLLKVFLDEEHSGAVNEAIFEHGTVLVSLLTLLEGKIQIRGLRTGGVIRPREELRLNEAIRLTLGRRPFKLLPMPPRLVEAALAQNNASEIHCRSLDRLHLAAMEEFGINRLMTHDLRQAGAARELGYEVVSPGLD